MVVAVVVSVASDGAAGAARTNADGTSWCQVISRILDIKPGAPHVRNVVLGGGSELFLHSIPPPRAMCARPRIWRSQFCIGIWARNAVNSIYLVCPENDPR